MEYGIGTFVKENWWLALLPVVLVIVGIQKGFVTEEVPQPGLAVPNNVGIPGYSPMAVSADENFNRNYLTNKQEVDAKEALTQYQQAYKEALSDDDKELNLLRMGNVCYHILFDYEQAILHYSDLIDRHPKTTHLETSYLAIADCYAKLGKSIEETSTYNTMLEKLPGSTPGHDYAKEKIYGKPSSEENDS